MGIGRHLKDKLSSELGKGETMPPFTSRGREEQRSNLTVRASKRGKLANRKLYSKRRAVKRGNLHNHPKQNNKTNTPPHTTPNKKKLLCQSGSPHFSARRENTNHGLGWAKERRGLENTKRKARRNRHHTQQKGLTAQTHRASRGGYWFNVFTTTPRAQKALEGRWVLS